MPKSLYMMVPRLNYLVFILDKVKSAFDDFVSAELIDAFPDMWFEYNNIPLKWDVPIGVQFDTYVGLKNQMSGELPW